MSQSLYSQPISQNRFKNAGSRSIYEKQKGMKKPNRHHTETYEDSLLSFQSQLDVMMNKKKQKLPQPSLKKPPNRYSERIKTNPREETRALRQQIGELKSLLQPKNQYQKVQSKLQMILKQLQLKKQLQNSKMPQQPVFMPPPPQYYYPQPYPQTPTLREMQRSKKYTEPYQFSEDQEQRQLYKPKPKKPRSTQSFLVPKRGRREYIRGKLRKIFFTVAFVIFVRSEAKKLSKARKNNLKKFWLQKFESQVNNIKNWVLEAHKYSLSIVLQKSNLDFSFFQFGTSNKVREQKEYLIMQLIHIGLKKLQQNSTSQKISLFSQILTNLCRRGSFGMNRFWSAQEMEQICISQYYGFFRVDSSLQKYLIGVLVFVKVFIFNLFLQPHKFDSENFPKYKQPISNNMKIISSVYYLLMKEVLEQYLQERRNKNVFKQGNWLSVQKQFIVECCEPLVFGDGYPEDSEYISGLYTYKQLKPLKNIAFWEESKEKIKSIIEKLHEEMLLKMKLMRKNLKYKLYN